jgi:SAM-dependent methyltransferase
MISDSLFRRFYPDNRHSGTLLFYSWLGAHLRPDMRILNIGAGPATLDPIRALKGKVLSVVGVDIDSIVLTNDELDEAHVIEDGRLPFTDDSIDLAYADYVFEHVENPRQLLCESWRVLRRGAPLFFRTPNRNHYVALGSRLTPHWFHQLVANRMRGLHAGTHEPWQTRYRLNSPKVIDRLARGAGFRTVEMRLIEAEPSYLVFNSAAFALGVAYERLVNSTTLLAGLRSSITGKLTK